MSTTTPRGTMKSYVIGFIWSIALTLIAYELVVNQTLIGWGLIRAIVGLAVAQLFVQLIFFLHLGTDRKQRWNVLALLFAGMVVLIVVVGSLWIMNHLMYQMSSPTSLDKAIIQDEGVHY